jgi:ubiquinone/menaquinone biosynthesis C-methylase UbiE
MDRPKTPITGREVKRANLSVYNRKSLESYEENRSIFNARRQGTIAGILLDLRGRSGGGSLLDIGCGTGNLVRLAREIFPWVVGVDLAHKLLVQVRATDREIRLAAADSEGLPFPPAAFDVVTLYAVLHHLLDPAPTFREAFRCLKPGGFLYTDHDPNRSFHRFYHVWYRWRYRGRPGFGSEEEEIAEYHNTQSGGLDPEILAVALREAGFRDVAVRYRITEGEDFSTSARLALKVLRGLAGAIPLKSLHTHFWILAAK